MKEDIIKRSCGRGREGLRQAVLIYHHCANCFHPNDSAIAQNQIFLVTDKIITGMNAESRHNLRSVKRVLNFPILHMVMVMDLI